MFDFASLPVVDNHCHPYLVAPTPERYAALDTFLGVRGEAPEALAHRNAMVYQRWSTRLLAEFFGCEPTPAAVAAARAGEADERRYVDRLFADAGIEALVVDMGYPQPPIDQASFLARTPVPVVPVYRIEPPIKALLEARVGFDEFVRRFDDGLRRAIRDEGYMAIKSIIAYRTGLDVDPSQQDDTAGRRALDSALAEPKRMSASKQLRDHLFCRTLRLSIELGVSLHVHTGVGDADVVLQRCNPALLNDVLKDPAFGKARVVLIHCYPYLAEASWLAAAWPNVWCDLSLGIPFAPVAADRILETALELAPTNRLLFGTDAFSGPEQSWLGAKLAKDALARVLATLHSRGLLTESESHEIAAAFLAGNARALYGLDG